MGLPFAVTHTQSALTWVSLLSSPSMAKVMAYIIFCSFNVSPRFTASARLIKTRWPRATVPSSPVIFKLPPRAETATPSSFSISFIFASKSPKRRPTFTSDTSIIHSDINFLLLVFSCAVQNRCFHCVFHEHCNGHGANAAGNRCNCSCFFCGL